MVECLERGRGVKGKGDKEGRERGKEGGREKETETEVDIDSQTYFSS
jgi:hypothetical protein